MRKLLILVLVLGLTSASYGYLISTSEFTATLVGTTLTLSSSLNLSGDNVSAGLYDIASQGTFTGGTTIGSPANAGALNFLGVYTGVGYSGFDFDAGSTGLEDPAWNAAAGDWYSASYSGSVGDTLQLLDYKVSTATPIGMLTVVPEPATIALLGLGGLALLRRRK